MDILPRRYKLFHFNLTVSPLSLIKLKNSTKTADRLLQHSVEPIVPKFHRKSFNVHFFPYLLEHSISSLPTKNLFHSRWFYQKFILKLNMVNFNM